MDATGKGAWDNGLIAQRKTLAMIILVLSLSAGQCMTPTTCDKAADVWTHNVYTLVRDYFILRGVRRASHVACSQEALGLARTLHSGPSPIHWQSGPAVSVATHENPSGLAVFVNLSCAAGVASMAAFFSTVPATWVVWSADPVAVKALEKLNLTLNADLTLVKAAPDGQTAELLEVFKVQLEAPLQCRSLGSWGRDCGLRTLPSLASGLSAGRRDLQGIALRAVVVFHHSTVDGDQGALRQALEDNRNINLDTQSRFGYGLATHLAEMYNFTYEIAVTPTWGFSVQANGSFDGMLGMLQRGEADLGITTSVISLPRLQAVDYTVQTWKFRVCFVFRHPRMLMPYKALAEPFALSSWLAVAVVCALVVALLAAVRRCEDASRNGSGGGGPVAEAALVVVGILSQQGSVLGSGLVSGRCVLLVSLLLGVMLQSFYTSAIVTSLLKPIPRTIRTIPDLIRSPLKVGLEEFVYNRAVFQNSTDPLTSSMYNDKILPAWSARPEGGFFSAADGVARVHRGDFAFGTEASTLYPPIEDTFSVEEKCTLSEVEFANSGNAAPIPKKSPYKELFSRGFLLMLESGLRDRQTRRWSAPKPACEKGTRTLTAVGLDPIFPAHALLLLGLVTALLLLGHERRSATTKTPTPPRAKTAEHNALKTVAMAGVPEE